MQKEVFDQERYAVLFSQVKEDSVGHRSTEQEQCPACGGPGRDRSYRIESFDLFRCRLCATEYLVQSPDRDPVDSTYWDGYKFELYATDLVQANYEDRYEQILSGVEAQHGPLESVLDIGCGIGNFIDWASRRGMRAVGADVDAGAVETAQGRGLTAFNVDDLPAEIPDGSVDLLTLWDVIEHVHDPRGLLQRSLRYLRPGGLVVMETPDVQFPARPFVIGVRKIAEPIRWSDMLYYADHQVYFSGRGLSTLMARCGLNVVDQQGMRSPTAKMANVMEHWAATGTGAGKLGPALYKPVDLAMRAIGMTNKLIMVGQLPE